MKKTLAIAFLAMTLTLSTATTAHGDTGTFTTDDGQSCTWTGSSGAYQVSCSGFDFRTSSFITCDYSVYGSSVSWRCRSTDGATWTGSR